MAGFIVTVKISDESKVQNKLAKLKELIKEKTGKDAVVKISRSN